MRVIGYLRVSTDRQADDGLGIQVQEQAIRRWAKGNGHKLVKVLSDEQSGTNGLERRFGLAEVLTEIAAKHADGVVVYRLDRLARDVILQEHLLREVWTSGGEVFSCSPTEAEFLQRDDPEDPTRRLVRTILGALAAYERDMISLRLRSGRRRKAENGGFAFGSPPFGYRSDGGNLIKVVHEQDAVRLMNSLRESGRSLPAICAALADAGFSPKRGGRWHPTVVARILARDSAS